MRRLLRFGLLVTCFVFLCAVSDSLWAQKGRGRGGGWKGGAGGPWHGGGFHPSGNRGGGRHFQDPSWSGGHFDGLSARGRAPSAPGPLGSHETSPLAPSTQFGGGRPLDRQRWNEERKLEHRRSVADHLRGVADKNGNENLYDVADRHDQKAQNHYDRRMEMLDRRDGFPEDAVLDRDQPVGDGAEPGETAEEQLSGGARRLTGLENARYRQLRNEERKLNQRMATVERLNQLYEQTGDPQYWDAAQRLETFAHEHYEQRLEKIAEFPQP